MYQEIGSAIVPSKPATLRRFVAGSALATAGGYALQASGYAQDIKDYAPIVKRGLDYANSVGKDALMDMAHSMTKAANEYQGLSDPKRRRTTPKVHRYDIVDDVTRKRDDKSRPRLEDITSNKKSRSSKARQTTLPYRKSSKYRRPIQMKKKWSEPVRKRKRRRYASKFGF